MPAAIVVPLVIAGIGAAATVGTTIYASSQGKKAQEEAQDKAYEQAEKLKHEQEAAIAQENIAYQAAKKEEEKKLEEQLIFSKQAQQVETLANLSAAKQTMVYQQPNYSYMTLPPSTPPQGGFINRFNSWVSGFFR